MGISNKVELVPPLEPEVVPTDSVDSQQLGRGHRQSRRSVLLNDYVTYTARYLENPTDATPLLILGLQVWFLILQRIT